MTRAPSDATSPSPGEKVVAFRLTRHHLETRADRGDLASVVRDVCGVQAQLPSGAEIALWARIRGLTRDDIERALWKDRSIVRTWAMRGTVHLLPADDLSVYVAALRETTGRDTEAWLLRSGLSLRDIEATTKAIVKALSEGPLTRDELAGRAGAGFPAKVRSWLAHGWGGLLKPASFAGLVCFGPDRGSEVTFVRRDRWMTRWREVPPAEAVAELLRRYLRAYGPATPVDFAGWSGMSVKAANECAEAIRTDLVEISDGGGALLLRKDLRVLESLSPHRRIVRLLPNFDVFLLGHRDKGHLVNAAHYKRVYRKAGWLSPVVLVDGRVAGVWSRARRARRLDVRVEPFLKLPRDVHDAVESEASDLARFLEADDVRVTFT